MSRLASASLLFLAIFCLISCGGPSGLSGGSLFTPTVTPADVPVTMSVQDSAPTGVTVLSFEIEVTSAGLLPGNVPLLSKPTDVELEHLQSEPALLGSLNVPAGTYTGVTVKFANPRMVILNNSSGPIPIPSGTCAVKTACNLMPALNSNTITVSGPTAPFPITLASKSPLGLLLHFDVNSSVQTDLSISPTIDLKQIVPNTNGVIHQQHLVGTITDVSSPPNFTLQPGLGAPTPVGLTTPPTLLIKTDSNTKYNFIDDLRATCVSNNFSCLANGQTVKVTLSVMSDGTLLATQISLFEQQNAPAFEGTVIDVEPGQNQFHMALMGGQWSPTAASITGAAVGVLITVNVTSSTVYENDSDGFTLPVGTFNGITDMVAGQTVEIQPSAVSVGPVANTLSLTTSRVRLDETQVTAKVASIDTSVTPPTAFTIGTLPPLFPATITSIKVQTIATQPPTQFQNVAAVSGLAVGDTVSVGGLLFNTAGTPTLVAEKVLKRTQCLATAAASTALVPCVMP